MKHLVIFAIFAILLVGTVTADYNYAQPTAPGFVQFTVRAVQAQDMTVWVVNDLQNITSFDKEFHYDNSVIVGQNPGVQRIVIDPCGTNFTQFAAGNFTAYMQNGNGNQLETIHFRVGAGWTTYVNFLGQAISPQAGPMPTAQPTQTVTVTPTPVPTVTATPQPTVTPTPTVTEVPTVQPTVQPTATSTPRPTRDICKPKHERHWWE